MEFFRAEGWAAGRGDLGVFADEALDGIGAETPATARGKQRLVPSAGALGHPDLEHGLAGPAERDGSLLAALAFAADAGSVSERDIPAVETGEFRDPKPRLHSSEQQDSVAASLPS